LNRHDPHNIVVSGVGGQGNILIARLLGRLFAIKGYQVSIAETFGAAQRGGSVFSSLRISKKKTGGPLIPFGRADIIIGIEPLETLRMLKYFGNPNVSTFTNDKPVYPIGVLRGNDRYPSTGKLKAALKTLSKNLLIIPATEAALECGGAIMANIVMLGALAGSELLLLPKEDIIAEVKESVPADKVSMNLKAFEMGFELSQRSSVKHLCPS